MTDQSAEDRAWVHVDDSGAVGSVRRAANVVAREMDLSQSRIADVAIVASELASNLFKHATDGVALVRAVRRAGVAGVELVVIDKGPGMIDLAASTLDGHSTAGTLGIGLGAATRQSTEFDGYSVPGAGTVIVATLWPDKTPAHASSEVVAAGMCRPMSGEDVSGDGYGVRQSAGVTQLMLCDGLGHGPLAAFAAQAASAAFRTAPDGGPKAVIEHLHQALRHTRGAVVTVVDLHVDRGIARFAGLGNVTACVVDGPARRMMMPQPGIAGHQRPQIRELEIALPPSAIVVMHSDGLNDRWRMDGYPGLTTHTPLVIAATLLRDAGVRRDDAGILVAKVLAGA